jgi:TetR/AcrR family transcriptional repressor of nem operon
MDRKEHILDSAEALVRQRGVDGFSYADIERDVGIRKASIHHHFASKATLALALIERYDARFMQRLEAIQTAQGNAAAQLLGYVATYRDALGKGDTVCLCVAYSAGRESLSSEVLVRLNDFHEKSVQWLQAVYELGDRDGSIAAVGAPATEAAATLALVEGAQLMARAAKNTALFDSAVAGLEARAR